MSRTARERRAEHRAEHPPQIMNAHVVHACDLDQQILHPLMVHRRGPNTVEREDVVRFTDDRHVVDDCKRSLGQRSTTARLSSIVRAGSRQTVRPVSSSIPISLRHSPSASERLAPVRSKKPDDLTVDGAEALIARRLPQGPDLVIVQGAFSDSLARFRALHAADDRRAIIIAAVLAPTHIAPTASRRRRRRTRGLLDLVQQGGDLGAS